MRRQLSYTFRYKFFLLLENKIENCFCIFESGKGLSHFHSNSSKQSFNLHFRFSLSRPASKKFDSSCPTKIFSQLQTGFLKLLRQEDYICYLFSQKLICCLALLAYTVGSLASGNPCRCIFGCWKHSTRHLRNESSYKANQVRLKLFHIRKTLNIFGCVVKIPIILKMILATTLTVCTSWQTFITNSARLIQVLTKSENV